MIDALFRRLDRWRHLPNYQLERRADVLFSLYLAEVLSEVTGVAISPRLIPEFPVKRDLIWPDKPSKRSVKVDYLCLAEDRSRAYLVELKTDGASRREAQDHYLVTAQALGLPALLEGLKEIVLASDAHQKYAHLLVELERLGCLSLPADLLDRCLRAWRRGAGSARPTRP